MEIDVGVWEKESYELTASVSLCSVGKPAEPMVGESSPQYELRVPELTYLFCLKQSFILRQQTGLTV